jgi:hypothetical protein
MMKGNMQSREAPEPARDNRLFDFRTREGERIVQIAIESWLSYYGICVLKPDDTLRADIFGLLETYGPYFMSCMGTYTGLKPSMLSKEVLHNIVASVILARAFLLNDPAARDKVKFLCQRYLNSRKSSLPADLNFELFIDLTLKQIQENLSDDLHEFVELAPPMEDLVEQLILEGIITYCRENNLVLSEELEEERSALNEEQDALMSKLTEVRTLKDRVWLLFNGPGFCNSIKQSLLLLSEEYQIYLAAGYYENQRVHTDEVLESLRDMGKERTERGAKINQNNFDRKIHYILRDVLPERLANEFANSLEHKLNHSDKTNLYRYLNPMALSFTDRVEGNPSVNKPRLLSFCQEGMGSTKGWLMSDELIKLCRSLVMEQGD